MAAVLAVSLYAPMDPMGHYVHSCSLSCCSGPKLATANGAAGVCPRRERCVRGRPERHKEAGPRTNRISEGVSMSRFRRTCARSRIVVEFQREDLIVEIVSRTYVRTYVRTSVKHVSTYGRQACQLYMIYIRNKYGRPCAAVCVIKIELLPSVLLRQSFSDRLSSNFFKPFQTFSKPFSNFFKLVQTFSNLFKLVQTSVNT